MFEKYTSKAIEVIMSAQAEAKKLNNNFVGTEHILLGLLTKDTASAQILNSLGADLEIARKEVEKIFSKKSSIIDDKIPFTQLAKDLLQNAYSEAKKFKQPISEWHLLLALVCLEGRHLDILKFMSIDVDKIKNCVEEKLEKVEIQDSIWKNNRITPFSYILFIIILLLISFVLLNDLISSLTLTNNNIISIIELIIITFLVRNSLVFTFGVGQVPSRLIQLIQIICLVIGVLFISVLILSSTIFIIMTIAKYKYLNS